MHLLSQFCRVGPLSPVLLIVFFFTDPAPTQIYTLSLHDALPISPRSRRSPTRPPSHRGNLGSGRCDAGLDQRCGRLDRRQDRKSTRLNSSHSQISYAVFCLKKKKNLLQHSESILSTPT